jgi:predicted DNA-binding protein YlxM (UPF0122 family)
MKMTLTEAAKLFGVTKQAISVAIRKGFIPAGKDGPDKRKVYVLRQDVAYYRLHRWNREHKFASDELSPHMAAEVIGVPVQRVYHLLRTGELPFWCKGKKVMTINYEDAFKLKDTEALRRKKKLAREVKRKTTRRKSSRRIVRKTNKPI